MIWPALTLGLCTGIVFAAAGLLLLAIVNWLGQKCVPNWTRLAYFVNLGLAAVVSMGALWCAVFLGVFFSLMFIVTPSDASGTSPDQAIQIAISDEATRQSFLWSTAFGSCALHDENLCRYADFLRVRMWETPQTPADQDDRWIWFGPAAAGLLLISAARSRWQKT
jgi:hypothetical protein